MPVRTGTRLIEVVRALDAAGVDATDVHRREATLDDVFLTLTVDPQPETEEVTHEQPRSTAATQPRTLRWPSPTALALARRNLAHVRQIPEKLIDVTLQPLMFVLLFAYVFGGVIDVPGGAYHEYLIGGILVQTLAFGMMGPGISIATDLTEGIVDRFRSLPMSRSAFLIGHLIAELAAATVALVVMIAHRPDRRLADPRGRAARGRRLRAARPVRHRDALARDPARRVGPHRRTP